MGTLCRSSTRSFSWSYGVFLKCGFGGCFCTCESISKNCSVRADAPRVTVSLCLGDEFQSFLQRGPGIIFSCSFCRHILPVPISTVTCLVLIVRTLRSTLSLDPSRAVAFLRRYGHFVRFSGFRHHHYYLYLLNGECNLNK